MKSGCVDFVDFVDKLVSRLTEGDQQILRTNHVTWLLAQVIRVELVMNALNTDARKVVFKCIHLMPFNCYHIILHFLLTFESNLLIAFNFSLKPSLEICCQVETTRKIISFHREDRSSDPNNSQSILLDFISSCQNLRIWSLNTSTREYLNNEQLQKGKQIDEWWRTVTKGKLVFQYKHITPFLVVQF